MAQVADECKALSSELFLSKYRIMKGIGKGSFGEAVLVRSKEDGKRYVAKAIESAAMSAKEKRDVQNEIRILAAANHPNIIRYHEHFEDGTLIFIVMEYADGGDLNTRIKDAKKNDPVVPFEPKLAMFWFLQICMALKYLHDNHILHRDLKTANIFLTAKNVVKLGDFGISTVVQNTLACAKTVCGTPYYFSPELCQNKPYNNKSDVWALGVILYELLTLQRPFLARSLKELLKKILVGQYEPIPSTVPAEIRGLCGALLQVNPVQRPSINRILESPFVQESLKGFSADLEKQAEKERAEYEARNPKITKPVKPVSTPEKPKEYPKEPQLSQKEQMAKLRGMNRESIKAMLAEQAAAGPPQEQQQQSPSKSEQDDGHHEVDDDGEYIEQKKLIVEQSKNIVGKTNLGGHPEEFGDGPSDSSPQEDMIILSSGKSVPASQVRAILEKEIGVKLLNEAAELVNQLMLNNEISNVDIQKQLNELLGAQHAHHSNAITKLCVYEGKKM
ncbi:serine/threonine-protein kinase, putative [Trypanosoma brucei brucei TREU927]|uniref:non-specific serine/threonine protein kinase n=2 Tax=Trypanosoma brucei TaxID=5691 RepID=Q57V67_TRYB2|nr:serine/threonine-protein kinase, putative [Trypanosoma brucei brucei TREU927]AAX70502.1 serine/threonine-protein kinase, putative [Trypanosoma brucei]AAZ10353.1 serine/threonine-protein kinase, putative [Trypanosoma brucei brucei TREU927]